MEQKGFLLLVVLALAGCAAGRVDPVQGRSDSARRAVLQEVARLKSSIREANRCAVEYRIHKLLIESCANCDGGWELLSWSYDETLKGCDRRSVSVECRRSPAWVGRSEASCANCGVRYMTSKTRLIDTSISALDQVTYVSCLNFYTQRDRLLQSCGNCLRKKHRN